MGINENNINTIKSKEKIREKKEFQDASTSPIKLLKNDATNSPIPAVLYQNGANSPFLIKKCDAGTSIEDKTFTLGALSKIPLNKRTRKGARHYK